jgi:hypothetical protein
MLRTSSSLKVMALPQRVPRMISCFAVRELHADELVVVIEVDRVESALVEVLELDEARLFHRAVLRRHEEVAPPGGSP